VLPSALAKLGDFDVHEPVGEGGMGVVRRAVHRPTGLHIAIKLIRGKGTRDWDFVAAFRAEVRAVASFDHPTVIRVLDIAISTHPQARRPELWSCPQERAGRCLMRPGSWGGSGLLALAARRARDLPRPINAEGLEEMTAMVVTEVTPELTGRVGKGEGVHLLGPLL
jgi:serine/threonine protein kinase